MARRLRAGAALAVAAGVTAAVAAGVTAAVAVGIILIGGLGVDTAAFAQSAPPSAERLDVARYGAEGRLELPGDIDRWIPLGSGLGGNYAETAFDPQSPGPITVVQMEPSAYDYFLRNKRYADGTMLLLSFYRPLPKPDPAVQGFVQGDLAQREIHVIDRGRFAAEGRAFFVFPPDSTSAAAMPVGSVCVECHTAHGAFDGTFAQFYPPIRGSVALDSSAPADGAASPHASAPHASAPQASAPGE